MADDVKEAVTYLSEAMNALLNLCHETLSEDSDEAEAVREIRAAKVQYDEILRKAGLLLQPPEIPKEAESCPMDLVTLAERMSSSDPGAPT